MWCHLENDGNGRWRGQGIAVEGRIEAGFGWLTLISLGYL